MYKIGRWSKKEGKRIRSQTPYRWANGTTLIPPGIRTQNLLITTSLSRHNLWCCVVAGREHSDDLVPCTYHRNTKNYFTTSKWSNNHLFYYYSSFFNIHPFFIILITPIFHSHPFFHSSFHSSFILYLSFIHLASIYFHSCLEWELTQYPKQVPYRTHLLHTSTRPI